MSWPLPQDFNEAVQNPAQAFADPDLKAGRPAVGAQGLPLPRSGNFADVYQVRGPDGRDWAAKCFTRQVFGLGERYAKVSGALAAANLPFGVGFSFLPEGIRVRGEWRPVVKMEWVEGLLLNQFVRDNLARPAVLAALAQMWGKLCRRLREAGIAHGDLQHGNVLLVPGARPGAFSLKLIDYDGMYVPALANTPSGEAGHPNYQHPARLATRAYSPDLDRFPHLVVATALRALEVGGPGLWDRYDTGDNLLFVEDDFRAPARSPLMRALWDTGDPALRALVGRLAAACVKPIPRTPWLDQIAPDGEPAPLDPEAAGDAAAALGLAAPVVVPLPAEPAPASGADVFAGLDLDDPEPAGRPKSVKRAGTRILDPEPEESPRTSGARRAGPRNRDREPGKKSTVLIAGIAAGVVLLAGAGIGGVLLLGGKKPAETAQADRHEAPKPEPKQDPPAPAKKQPKDPDPAPPTRPPAPAKVEGPAEVVPPPVTPDPAPGNPAPAGPLNVKRRWLVNVPPEAEGHLVFDRDGRVVVIGSTSKPEMLSTFRAEDGSRGPGFGSSAVVRGLFGLDRGRIAYQTGSARELMVRDVQTGQQAGQIPLPPCPTPTLPAGGALAGDLRGYVSPDGRYAATSGHGTFLKTGDKPTFGPGPLRLAEVATGKVLLATDWRPGRLFFTADSSRVLLAEQGGRFRWYQLPSGQPDGEWQLPEGNSPALEQQNWTIGMSADGGVVLYAGPAANGPGVYALDGRTGRMIWSFGATHHIRAGAVSPDGRMVALARKEVPPDGVPVVDLVDLAARRQLALRLDLRNMSTSAGVPLFSPDGRGLVIHQGPSLLMIDVDGGLVAAGPRPPTPTVPPPAPTPTTTPNASPKARDPIELKPRWTFTTTEFGTPTPVIDPATDSVFIGSTVLNLRTGAVRPGFEAAGRFSRVETFPLDRGRVATHVRGDPAVRVWVAKTGQPAPKMAQIAVPPLPSRTVGGSVVFLSPNGRYMVAAHPGTVMNGARPDVPCLVVDTTTGKTLLKLEWKGGSAHFTTDSARLLVADIDGRFRWFKLPSGQPDGEWSFESAGLGLGHRISGMSGDGRVLGYTGQGKSGKGNYNGQLLDGKTGETIVRYPGDRAFVFGPVRVSADGKLAAVLRSTFGTEDAFETVDVATGAVLARAVLPEIQNKFVRAFSLSPDGRHLAVYDSDAKKGYLYDIPVGGPVGPAAGPAVARAPVPADAAVEKAQKLVRETLKEDFARKQPAEKKALAQKLMTLADDTADDPAARYVMLREAGDLAAEAGDPALAAAAADGLARWYELDATGLKAAALEKVAAGSAAPAAQRAVYEAAVAAADAADAADDFAAAARFAGVAAAAARKGNLGTLAAQDADLRAAHAKKTADGLAALKPARDVLKATPDDPAANLAVGRYLCFTLGKWEEGVKHLAKGGHPGLKAAAEADLAAQTGMPDLKVADAWHDYAKAALDGDRWEADSRGRYWDVRVAAGLTGLSKAKAEARIGFTAGGVEYRPGLVAEFQSRPAAVLKGKKTRVDPTLDFSAAEFADPARNPAEVTAKWTGAIAPPRAGLYKLAAESADHVRVRVDGKVVIDTAGKDTGRAEGVVLLGDRPAAVVVEYTGPNTAGHGLKLKWVAHGADEELIPAEYLYHDRKADAGVGK